MRLDAIESGRLVSSSVCGREAASIEAVGAQESCTLSIFTSPFEKLRMRFSLCGLKFVEGCWRAARFIQGRNLQAGIVELRVWRPSGLKKAAANPSLNLLFKNFEGVCRRALRVVESCRKGECFGQNRRSGGNCRNANIDGRGSRKLLPVHHSPSSQMRPKS